MLWKLDTIYIVTTTRCKCSKRCFLSIKLFILQFSHIPSNQIFQRTVQIQEVSDYFMVLLSYRHIQITFWKNHLTLFDRFKYFLITSCRYPAVVSHKYKSPFSSNIPIIFLSPYATLYIISESMYYYPTHCLYHPCDI